jgi:hypothetical protein
MGTEGGASAAPHTYLQTDITAGVCLEVGRMVSVGKGGGVTFATLREVVLDAAWLPEPTVSIGNEVQILTARAPHQHHPLLI